MTAEKQIIVYDDQCNLCLYFIGFIKKNVMAQKFNFYPFGSTQLMEFIDPEIVEIKNKHSIVFIKGNRIMMKSKAILYIFKELKGLWPLLFLFIIIPRFISDSIYDFIAKNRYSWFGCVSCNKANGKSNCQN